MKTPLKILALCLATLIPATAAAEAKYVFYFIGDGMGMGHVNATATYLRDVARQPEQMLMMTFPVASQVRTYSANHPVTDSAAAGTALSTGSKTNNYTVGMTPDSTAVESIAVPLMKAGYSVGVATSVYGDDATPSAFYAHVPNRKRYADIAAQAVTSNLDFLGAAAFKGIAKTRELGGDWVAEMQKAGYTFVEGFDNFPAARPAKTLMVSSLPQGDQIGYTLDSIPGANTLRQLTASCLAQMEGDDRKPFFMMVEAGNIDWAAHANDGAAVIKEIINFQEAIDVAYKFYLQHPDETLIVVTADHDTGGMALGRRDNRNPDLSLADFQKISKDRFSDYWRSRMEQGQWPDWEEMEAFLKQNLGFWGVVKTSEEETEALRRSFDETFVSRSGKEEKTLYNDFSQFTVTVYDIFNRHLGVGWTTTNHTGNFVPLYAVGSGAELFTSNMNNTEVPATILRAALGENK